MGRAEAPCVGLSSFWVADATRGRSLSSICCGRHLFTRVI